MLSKSDLCKVIEDHLPQRLMVPPAPSDGPLPRLVAKKCHSADISNPPHEGIGSKSSSGSYIGLHNHLKSTLCCSQIDIFLKGAEEAMLEKVDNSTMCVTI